MIGQVLDDRYAILRLVGQGGMGAVYEARHLGTNRRVAVKVILDSAMDAEQIARFEREAGIVGAIESQHITLVYDTGRDRATGAPYIAMELLDGEDAEVLLARLGPLPIDLALRIAYQACLGLGRAHQAGVVHRDVKTANLFLHRNEAGQRIVKILDFGIAKSTAGEALNPSLTRTGTLLGSPIYMSPEQARSGKVDQRGDVWSLGITLYEMLCGSRPNDELQQLGELIIAICTQPVPRIEQRAPRVPSELAALVHRALTIDPAARFASAVEMGEALRAMLPNGQAIDEAMLRPASAAELGQSAVLRPPSATVGGLSLAGSGVVATSSAPRASSRMPLVAGAVVLGALGAIGAAAWLMRSPEAPVGATPASGELSAAAAISAAPAISAEQAAPMISAAPGAAAASAPASTAALSTVPRPPAGAPPRPSVSTKPVIKKAASDDESSRK
jgi:serine/threonine-protein kinase